MEYVGQMIAATPVEVVADFFPALDAHDKLSALTVLRDVETLRSRSATRTCSPRWSTAGGWPRRCPAAELLVLDGAGHLAMMERPALVTLRLRAFLHRAARAAYGGSRAPPRGVR